MRLLTFLKDDSGAVTVDWVVLTAAIVGLGITSVGAVRMGTGSMAEQIRASLSGATIWGSNRISGDVMDTNGLQQHAWGWRAFGEFAGWDVTDGNHVNIVQSGYRGVDAPNGENFISLNGSNNIPSTIERTIDGLAAGQTQTLSFNAYDNGNNSMNVYFGGELVGQYSPGRNLESAQIQLIGGMGDGSNRLTFEGIGPASGGGMWLNDIQLRDSVH